MIIGYLPTSTGNIPQVTSKLNYSDYWGTIKVRWGVNRNNYKITPGLYAVGSPNELSDVFVTANYKLSFDHLRKNLDGLDAWILVLDTKGVNVWCAAGKGTFGTKELVNRIKITNLDKIINHRRIIVPQLGATGISAHKVKAETEIIATVKTSMLSNLQTIGTFFKPEGAQLKANRGFNVIYGPVRAADIKPFINNGYKTNKEMRRVNFGFFDRLKLIPVDFMYGKKYLVIVMAIILILSGINAQGLSFKQILGSSYTLLNVFLGYIAGIVITPILLPYIPFRPFALKGFIIGLLVWTILCIFGYIGKSTLENISWVFIISSISSFVAMNFTGSSTYTSLSGVKKEMKVAIPLQIAFAALGLILFTIGKIF